MTPEQIAALDAHSDARIALKIGKRSDGLAMLVGYLKSKSQYFALVLGILISQADEISAWLQANVYPLLTEHQVSILKMAMGGVVFAVGLWIRAKTTKPLIEKGAK